MDKRIIAFVGLGLAGAVIYLFMNQSENQDLGGAGAGAGGSSKKETTSQPVTNEPGFTETITTTTEPFTQPITYNIILPEDPFPVLPQPVISEPWWISSADPPAPAVSKKEVTMGETSTYRTAEQAKQAVTISKASDNLSSFLETLPIQMRPTATKKQISGSVQI